jgi:hypothetical protein
MNTSWGTKTAQRRKRVIRQTKFRWDVLGLQGPAQSSSAPSIEDIRRQITSAASQGLSPDTLSRSRQKEGRPQPGSKASVATRKRGTASQ